MIHKAKRFFLFFLFTLILMGFSPLYGENLFLARIGDDNFSYPPKYDDSSEKEKPKPAPPLLFPFGLRFSGVVDHLRGSAFNYQNNTFGYDQFTTTGVGFEFELTYRATKTWYVYGSVDFITFGNTGDFVNLNDTSTDPNTVSYIPIEFSKWNLLDLSIGGKYYPFEEETGLLPFMKIGMGFSIQPELKSTFQGTTEVQIKGGARFALEGGAGLEYRLEWKSMRLGLVVEVIILRLIKQPGGLLRGSNNMYAFPLKLGINLYF